MEDLFFKVLSAVVFATVALFLIFLVGMGVVGLLVVLFNIIGVKGLTILFTVWLCVVIYAYRNNY